MREKIVYISDDGEYEDTFKERVEHYDEVRRKEKEELEQASKNLEDYIIGEFISENKKYYLVRFTEKNTIEGFRTLFLKKHPGIRVDTKKEIEELLEDNKVCFYQEDGGYRNYLFGKRVSTVVRELNVVISKSEIALEVLRK